MNYQIKKNDIEITIDGEKHLLYKESKNAAKLSALKEKLIGGGDIQLSWEECKQLSRNFCDAIAFLYSQKLSMLLISNYSEMLNLGIDAKFDMLIGTFKNYPKFTVKDILYALKNKENCIFNASLILSEFFKSTISSTKDSRSKYCSVITYEGKIYLTLSTVANNASLYAKNKKKVGIPVFESPLSYALEPLNKLELTDFDIEDFSKVSSENILGALFAFIQYKGEYKKLFSRIQSCDCKHLQKYIEDALIGLHKRSGLLKSFQSLNPSNIKIVDSCESIELAHIIFDCLGINYTSINDVNWAKMKNAINENDRYISNFEFLDQATFIQNYKLSEREEIIKQLIISSTYRDYLRIRTQLLEGERIDKNQYPVILDNPKDIKKYHDAIVNVYNKYRDIIKNESLNNLKSKFKKYLYENDKYKVIMPEKTEDIVSEGEKLHHCVASYVDRVCNGDTTILFIREKTDLKKPFYTVEVYNDGTVNQVYGFGDKVATTEVNNFVKEWQEKNQFINKLNYYGMAK